jgi:hypothetical protein
MQTLLDIFLNIDERPLGVKVHKVVRFRIVLDFERGDVKMAFPEEADHGKEDSGGDG